MHRSRSNSSGRSYHSHNSPYHRGNNRDAGRMRRSGGPNTARRDGGDRRNKETDNSKDLHNVRMGSVQAELPANLCVSSQKAVQCNATRLDIRRATAVYQYDLEMKGFKGKDENEVGEKIYEASNNDSARNSKYLAFNRIFLLLLEEYSTFFKSDELDGEGKHKNLYVYDRSRFFYCNLDLLEAQEERTFMLDTRKIAYEYRAYVAQYRTIEIRLKKTARLEVKNVMLDLSFEFQRPILQYLDILFNQYAYQNDKFYVFGDRMFFKDSKDEKPIQEDNRSFILKPGLQKNVRVTEQGLVLQVDARHAAFYAAPQYLTDLLIRGLDIERRELEDPRQKANVLKQIKGIAVQTTHLEAPRSFVITDLSSESARRLRFNYNGREISVADYFWEKYEIKLRYPDFLCIQHRNSYHPIECLKIVPGQRVPRDKMTKQFTAAMITASQIRPAELVEKLDTFKEDAGLTNGPLKTSGVRVSIARVEARGQQIPMPAIVYRDNMQSLKQAKWSHENSNIYIKSGTIRRLALVTDRRDENTGRQWIQKVISQAKEHGLTIESSKVRLLKASSHDAIHRFAADLALEGFDFLMFISDSKDLHEAIKFSELRTRVPTQQVCPRSMRKGADTNRNIIHKMNLKSGGVNCAIATAPGDAPIDIVKSLLTYTVVIAVEMSHPGAQPRHDRLMKVFRPEPTSVGIAYTHDSSGSIQNGRYFYIPRGTAVITHHKLTDIVKDAVRNFHAKQGHQPLRVLIYRSGISEGSFSDVAKHECSAIVDGLKEESMTPSVTMVVMQRKSNHRLLLPEKTLKNMRADARAILQNVTPGTCVTTEVTSPRYPEFVMASQQSAQGTSRPVVGTVIFESDQKKRLPLDHLAQLSNALCYQLEIVTGSIALPAPLQSASHLAMRGLSNWKYALKIGVISDLSHIRMPADNANEEIKAQYHASVQAALDAHSDELAVTIKDNRFWA